MNIINKYKFNETKHKEFIAFLISMFIVFSAVFYICYHLDKFSTIYR